MPEQELCIMRTGELIAAFELSFTTSFKHTARVKWGVDFDNSNIERTRTNLEQLKHNMQHNQPNAVHVGYEITLEDVDRAQAILTEMLQRWKELTRIPPPAKLYTFTHQLEKMETPSPAQQAKKIVTEILTPKPAPNATKKEQKQAEIDAEKRRRVIEMERKQNKKR